MAFIVIYFPCSYIYCCKNLTSFVVCLENDQTKHAQLVSGLKPAQFTGGKKSSWAGWFIFSTPLISFSDSVETALQLHMASYPSAAVSDRTFAPVVNSERKTSIFRARLSTSYRLHMEVGGDSKHGTHVQVQPCYWWFFTYFFKSGFDILHFLEVQG